MPKIPLTADDLDKMEIDDSTSELYWDGKKLKTETTLTLDLWVNIAIVLSSLAAIGSAIVAFSALNFSKVQANKTSKIDISDAVEVQLGAFEGAITLDTGDLRVICTSSGVENTEAGDEIVLSCQSIEALEPTSAD